MNKKLIIGFSFVLLLVFLWHTNTEAIVCRTNVNVNLNMNKEDDTQVFSYKNKKIFLSDDDIYLMAQVVFAESRAEPYQGKIAVASVILNRLLHPEFPKSVEDIIKQKGAFSCVKNGKLTVTPTEECYDAVYEALKGKDPTGEAVFFYNPRIATSKWMINVKKSNVKPIGNHVFFVVR
jgi:N-acetylmuramoyl-L-alanine amidase